MSRKVSQVTVPLSRLVASKRNPRRVKPAREAHHRMVALLRSQGLLQPLLIRPMEDRPGFYRVIAGHRRLAGLQEIHRGDRDPKIPCVVRDVDAATADALSLGENFGQQPMHPLDEAQAFAKLALQDGKDAAAIAAEFGVGEHYIRQRMKLASLSAIVKAAYRTGEIDTATAEAFAALPDDRQAEVWTELNGHPRHAEHVRNIIANSWIDADRALFDVSNLTESLVSRDLFGQKILIQRAAFMATQNHAIEAERQKMLEDGWHEVVTGDRQAVQDRLYAMERPEQEFDAETAGKLDKIAARRIKLEKQAEKIGTGDADRSSRLQQRFATLDTQEHEIIAKAPLFVSEETKSVATAFLILHPDGAVRMEYRIPRPKRSDPANGHPAADGITGEATTPKPKTSGDLADSQLAATFTHQALAVREALLADDTARKRILALILHDKVRSEALAVRHEANGTTIHASGGDTFTSAAFDRLQRQRAKLDPFTESYGIADHTAYARLAGLVPAKLESLIDMLIVSTITAHMQRRTELVQLLADELKVNIRDHWTPDAAWLSGYQKIQLSHLMAELRGPVYSPVSQTRKKSELVEALASLFADAASGKLDDKKLAERANSWLPSNLREPTPTEVAAA